jgi:hypothetical protein
MVDNSKDPKTADKGKIVVMPPPTTTTVIINSMSPQSRDWKVVITMKKNLDAPQVTITPIKKAKAPAAKPKVKAKTKAKVASKK